MRRRGGVAVPLSCFSFARAVSRRKLVLRWCFVARGRVTAEFCAAPGGGGGGRESEGDGPFLCWPKSEICRLLTLARADLRYRCLGYRRGSGRPSSTSALLSDTHAYCQCECFFHELIGSANCKATDRHEPIEAKATDRASPQDMVTALPQ
jgi:hypothetical protein